MIRLASKATLLSAVALVIAGAALAGVPNATNSTINAAPNGPRMVLMGTNGTGAAFGGGVSAQANCTANAVLFGGYDAKVIGKLSSSFCPNSATDTHHSEAARLIQGPSKAT